MQFLLIFIQIVRWFLLKHVIYYHKPTQFSELGAQENESKHINVCDVWYLVHGRYLEHTNAGVEGEKGVESEG